MSIFHTLVKLWGFDFQDSQLTFNLAAGITTDHVGLAVTQDTTADNTVKLAGDGDEIIGTILTVEARTVEGTNVGTISLAFADKLQIKSGLTGNAVVARGSRLCGAGAGQVKAIDLTGTPSAATIAMYAKAPRVWEIRDSGATAVAIKLA